MCKKVCNFVPFFAEIRKIIENKALLTKKNFYNYEDAMSCGNKCCDKKCCQDTCCHQDTVEVVEAEAAVEVAE